jgi:hypothetical protein
MRVVLLTMVKNESAILRRLLESVRLSVQAVVVCDTGSTDSTVAVAEAWLAEAGIPGAVYTYPFTTFGESRTESFRRCQSWVTSQGWPADETWCLVLDGDMVLEGIVVPSDLSVEADVAGISLKQVNGGLVYGNLRVLRSSEPWVCRGSTHEAWVCPSRRRTTTLASPMIQDLNDGGSRADKFERDVRLLREDLVAMPDDARTLFYLGQTYKSMGKSEEAREVLLKRIEVGGWDEETYMARVYLGDCSDGDHAVTAWLAAWESRPARSEAALRLITFYRKKPKSQFMAAMFLEKLFLTQFGEEFASGARVGLPMKTEDTLFVDRWGIAVGIWLEIGILGYYTGRREVTFLRLDEWDLTAGSAVSWSDSNSVLGNLQWYQVLESPRQKVQIELPVSTLPWADEDEAYVWMPFNPSLRLEADGYTVNLRYANYSTENAATTMYRGSTGKVITRNCLIRIAGEEWMRPESVVEAVVEGAVERKESRVLGIEDCRFIQGPVESEPMLLGTSVSYTADGVNKMFMVVGSETRRGAWSASQMPLPVGVAVDVCQKNWLGFFHLGELLYIYGWNPYRVCDASGKTRVGSGSGSASDSASAYSLAGYRGSAAPVAWRSVAFPDERYLCAVHKVYSGSEGRRYYQRFVTLGSDLQPSRISCFLRMTTKKVEYWSGLCPSLGRRPGLIESYWLAYGINDSQAWLAEIGAAEIEARLWYDARRGVGVPFSSRKSS